MPKNITIPLLMLAGFAGAMQLRVMDPMLLKVAADFQVDIKQAALLTAAYAFPFAAMQLLLGPAGDSFGKTRVIKIGLVMLAIATFASALAWSFGALFVMRGFAGAAAGGIVPICMALVSDLVPYERRQQAIGKIMMTSIFGQVIGAAAAGLLVESIGWRVLIACFGTVVLVTSIMVSLTLPQLAYKPVAYSLKGVSRTYWGLLQQRRFQAPTLLACGYALAVYWLFPFTAAILYQRGYNGTREAGFALVAFTLGGVCNSAMVGLFVRFIGQKRMVWLGLLMAGASFALGSLTPSATVLIAGFFMGGVGFFMAHSTVLSFVSEVAPATRGSALALFLFFFFTSQGMGAVVGAIAAHFIDIQYFPAAIGLLMIGLGLASIFGLYGRPGRY